jgi:hypothetical protein
MPQAPTHPPACRRFEFERDTFAFANELVCEYVFDPAGGRGRMVLRRPRPNYTLRCFVLVRAARRFLYHAEFHPEVAPAGEREYRHAIREVVRRSPREPSAAGRRVVFPGHASLRAFSGDHEALLKAECGGAWRSYVLRSHWRMVFPITRRHQQETALRLVTSLEQGVPPVVHLVRFPQLTINHGMLVYGVEPGPRGMRFRAYDPNDPAGPTTLTFDEGTRTFTLPANRYWSGGRLDVIEICRNWWF